METKSAPVGRARALLLLVLCALAAYAAYSYRQRSREDAAMAAAGAPAAPLRDGVPGADEAAVPASVATPPASAWLDHRMKRYAALFNGTQCDLLLVLVPVQVEGGGFDRPNREIMTADLALALAASGHCVTDPYLVDLALGEGLRRRPADAVRDLALTIKASRVITVYAGHYSPGKMRVTLQVGGPAADKPAAAHSFEDLEYGDENPPFMAFRAEIPRMLSAVGLDSGAAARTAGSAPGALSDKLPSTLDEYLQPLQEAPAQGDPLTRSARLAFLGMLAPCLEWRATERLFTKAWVALESADPADPAVRRLRARILLHLHERPLALSTIKDDPGPEAEGLRAVLNGDLPQARQALMHVQGAWERFFLGIEVHDLELSYGRDSESTARGVLQLVTDSEFLPFVDGRLVDRDLWSFRTATVYKQLLDKAAPIAGFDLSETPSGNLLMNLLDHTDLELSALRHVHRLLAEQPLRWCCASFIAVPRASDLLDLFDSRVELTLGRQAYYYVNPQGNYDSAQELLNDYDAELAGSPCTEDLRALIYWDTLWKTPPDQREAQTQKMHDAARLSGWWSQAQSPDTDTVFEYMQAAPTDPVLAYLVRYTDDYPMRPYWSANLHKDTAVARLAFSSDDPYPLKELIDHSQGAQRAAYVAELERRFLGNSQATDLRLVNMDESQKTPEFMRAEIARDPENWEIYDALFGIQLRKNSFAEASHTALSFPPLAAAQPERPVAMSNVAGQWGETLLWLGAIEQSRPLLEKSAGYRTGSAAGGFAEARLAMLDQHFGEAAGVFEEVARHYDDVVAYRELTSLMFAAGLNEQAWAVFDRVTRDFDAPGMLPAALVGHRRAGLGDTDLRAWYLARATGSESGELRHSLRISAYVEEMVDRAPGPDFPETMRELALVTGPNANNAAADVAKAQPARAHPSAFGKDRHPKIAYGSPAPDGLAMAAEGMVAFQSGEYGEAVAAFDRLSSFHRIETDELLYVVPYFAYAAAKTGDTLRLRQFLDALPEEQQSYDVTLGRAVFTGMAMQSGDALTLLDRALRNWAYVHDNNFPASAYQYLDTCTRLFEATGDDRYRQAALRLARLLRRVEPAFAYAHALVAYLGSDDAERIEALRTALYLDPRSLWASKVPAVLRARAQAAGAGREGPFVGGANECCWSQLGSGQ